MRYLDDMWNYIQKPFNIVIKNPLFILSSFFVDILFFLLFGVIYSFFSTGIMDNLIEVNSIVSELNSNIAALQAGAENPALLAELAVKQGMIMAHVKSIVISIAAIVVATYILWCVFQGINWHNAGFVRTKKKTLFSSYLGKFFLINLVWLAVSGFVGYAIYKLSVYNTLLRVEVISQEAINIIMVVLLAVLFYFAVVSYAFAGQKFWSNLKNTFVFGVKKANYFVSAYILIALALFIVYYAISLFNIDLIAAVPLNLLFMLPVLAYGRVLFLEVSGNIGKKKGK